jgi:hypothetical protein
MASQLPTMNGNEVGALFRLLSVFTAGLSINQPVTEIQLAAIDDMIKFLSRSSILSPLDRNYLQSMKSKIDVYYGVPIGQIVTSNQ